MSEWIPITERLPDKNDDVIFHYERTGLSGAKYRETDVTTLAEVTRYYKPLYWMPIPDPPNEETVSNPLFDIVEEHDHCHVQVLRDSITGEISVGWWEEKE